MYSSYIWYVTYPECLPRRPGGARQPLPGRFGRPELRRLAPAELLRCRRAAAAAPGAGAVAQRHAVTRGKGHWIMVDLCGFLDFFRDLYDGFMKCFLG